MMPYSEKLFPELRELSLLLRDDLEGEKGHGVGGRLKGGDKCILTADS